MCVCVCACVRACVCACVYVFVLLTECTTMADSRWQRRCSMLPQIPTDLWVALSNARPPSTVADDDDDDTGVQQQKEADKAAEEEKGEGELLGARGEAEGEDGTDDDDDYDDSDEDSDEDDGFGSIEIQADDVTVRWCAQLEMVGVAVTSSLRLPWLRPANVEAPDRYRFRTVCTSHTVLALLSMWLDVCMNQ